MKVAVTGTPGTGKTSVAKYMAKELGWKYINLAELAQEKGCLAGFDTKRNCHIIDTKKLGKVVGGMKGDIVLDSHFSHEMDADFVIILRADPKELWERMENKGWPEDKIKENIQAEIMEICTEEAREAGKRFKEIDTTGKLPSEVAKEAIKALKKLNIK